VNIIILSGGGQNHPKFIWKVAHQLVAHHVSTLTPLGQLFAELYDEGVDKRILSALIDATTDVLAAGACHRN